MVEIKDIKDSIASDLATIGAIKSEKDAMAFVENKMLVGATDSTLNRQLAVLSFGLGKASKGNAPANFEPLYVAYNKRARGGTTGRKVQTSRTVETYVSYYNAFALLGFVKGWDAAELAFPWILQNVSGGYGDRGSFIRKVAALTEAPDVAKLEAMWKEAEKKPKLDRAAAQMAKAVKDMPKTFAMLQEEGNLRKTFAKMVLAVQNFEAAAKLAAKGDDEETDVDWSAIMSDAA